MGGVWRRMRAEGQVKSWRCANVSRAPGCYGPYSSIQGQQSLRRLCECSLKGL